MNRAPWQIAIAFLAFAAVEADQTEAGVKGSRYQGSVTGQTGVTTPQTMDFRTNGSYILQEVQTNGTFTFQGAYQEIDLGVISFWNAVVADGSPNGQGELNGISIFGFFTTVTSTNADVNVLAKGFSIRSGPAQRTTEKADSSTGILGGSAE